MSGLASLDAHAIAQLVVQYIANTGACVIDLPTVAPALDICTSIEVRFSEQEVIERRPDSICITSTQPMPIHHPIPPTSEKRPLTPPGPGGRPSPWSTNGWPRTSNPNSAGGGGGDGGGGGWAPPQHGRPESMGMPPHAPGPGKEGPHVWQPPPYSPPSPHDAHPASPPPHPVYQPLSPPGEQGGDGGGGRDRERIRPESPGENHGEDCDDDDSPGEPAGPPPPPPPAPTSPEKPDPPGAIKVPSSSQDPPPPPTNYPEEPLQSPDPPSPPPPPPPPATPAPLPVPQRPQQAPPPDEPEEPDEPGEPTEPEESDPLPPAPATVTPTPTPTPSPVTPAAITITTTTSTTSSPTATPTTQATPESCDTGYTSIDVSDILTEESEEEETDPNDHDQYLGLIGMELINHHHGASSSSSSRTKTKTIHQYRVRCDVSLPEAPTPAFPAFPAAKEYARAIPRGGRRACLEACEREAFGVRAGGKVRMGECLGIAFRGRVGVGGRVDGDGEEGEGECRFWGGERGLHEFLPVGDLLGGNGGRWQVLYM